MRRQHRLRRAFLAVVALAAVACASLGVLAGLGVWKPQEGLVGGLSGLRALTGHPAAPPPCPPAQSPAHAPDHPVSVDCAQTVKAATRSNEKTQVRMSS